MGEIEVGQILPVEIDRPPLRSDAGGVVRIGDSRVTLDLIVEQYENGMTPEEMVRGYETLSLADVHAAIAYYLRHGNAVREYLKRRGADAAAVQARIEADRPRVSRDELAERHNAAESTNAPIGQ
jgi:uncharacterized protein (DUF433 family)